MNLYVNICGKQYELSEWSENNKTLLPLDYVGRTLLNNQYYMNNNQYYELPFMNDEIGFYLDLTFTGYKFGGSGLILFIAEAYNKIYDSPSFRIEELSTAKLSVDDFIVNKLSKLSTFL